MADAVRLHREFFDLIRDIEYAFKYKANIREQASRPLIDEAIARYRDEGVHSLREYLISALKRNPIIYNAIPDNALGDLAGDPGAASAREAWRNSRPQDG